MLPRQNGIVNGHADSFPVLARRARLRRQLQPDNAEAAPPEAAAGIAPPPSDPAVGRSWAESAIASARPAEPPSEFERGAELEARLDPAAANLPPDYTWATMGTIDADRVRSLMVHLLCCPMVFD